MNDKPYQVRFTGKLKPGMSASTVQANLVLEIGVPDEKAAILLKRGESLVKRFATAQEAQKLAEKLTRAGALSEVTMGETSGNEKGVGRSLFSSFLQAFAVERG